MGFGHRSLLDGEKVDVVAPCTEEVEDAVGQVQPPLDGVIFEWPLAVGRQELASVKLEVWGQLAIEVV